MVRAALKECYNKLLEEANKLEMKDEKVGKKTKKAARPQPIPEELEKYADEQKIYLGTGEGTDPGGWEYVDGDITKTIEASLKIIVAWCTQKQS